MNLRTIIGAAAVISNLPKLRKGDPPTGLSVDSDALLYKDNTPSGIEPPQPNDFIITPELHVSFDGGVSMNALILRINNQTGTGQTLSDFEVEIAFLGKNKSQKTYAPDNLTLHSDGVFTVPPGESNVIITANAPSGYMMPNGETFNLIPFVLGAQTRLQAPFYDNNRVNQGRAYAVNDIAELLLFYNKDQKVVTDYANRWYVNPETLRKNIDKRVDLYVDPTQLDFLNITQWFKGYSQYLTKLYNYYVDDYYTNRIESAVLDLGQILKVTRLKFEAKTDTNDWIVIKRTHSMYGHVYRYGIGGIVDGFTMLFINGDYRYDIRKGTGFNLAHTSKTDYDVELGYGYVQ